MLQGLGTFLGIKKISMPQDGFPYLHKSVYAARWFYISHNPYISPRTCQFCSGPPRRPMDAGASAVGSQGVGDGGGDGKDGGGSILPSHPGPIPMRSGTKYPVRSPHSDICTCMAHLYLACNTIHNLRNAFCTYKCSSLSLSLYIYIYINILSSSVCERTQTHPHQC